MLIDCHVHSWGNETARQILEGMDAAGLEKIILFAPPPGEWGREESLSMRAASEWLAGIAEEGAGRIIPFAWIEPTLPGAVDELDHAVVQLGFKGVKMIPNHWYPTDEVVFPVYEKMAELGVPLIAHSGILFGHTDGSRFCRPAYYEALVNFPGVRFALAHIGWPWVDECLAVAGRFRAHSRRAGQPMQMWIDTTPGTPPIWRTEALQKTLAYLGHERILWGSDASGSTIAAAADKLASDRRILRGILGSTAEVERSWMEENVLRFLGMGVCLAPDESPSPRNP